MTPKPFATPRTPHAPTPWRNLWGKGVVICHLRFLKELSERRRGISPSCPPDVFQPLMFFSLSALVRMDFFDDTPVGLQYHLVVRIPVDVRSNAVIQSQLQQHRHKCTLCALKQRQRHRKKKVSRHEITNGASSQMAMYKHGTEISPITVPKLSFRNGKHKQTCRQQMNMHVDFQRDA